MRDVGVNSAELVLLSASTSTTPSVDITGYNVTKEIQDLTDQALRSLTVNSLPLTCFIRCLSWDM